MWGFCLFLVLWLDFPRFCLMMTRFSSPSFSSFFSPLTWHLAWRVKYWPWSDFDTFLLLLLPLPVMLLLSLSQSKPNTVGRWRAASCWLTVIAESFFPSFLVCIDMDRCCQVRTAAKVKWLQVSSNTTSKRISLTSSIEESKKEKETNKNEEGNGRTKHK